jgi:hypothetical protein
MRNPFNFETAIEQGASIGKAVVKGTVNHIKPTPTSSTPGQQLPSSPIEGLGIDPMTKEFVDQLYGVPTLDPNSPEAQKKQVDDHAKLAQARKLLESQHKDYVQRTFHAKREETTADRLERQDQEKKEEDWMAQQEKRKKEEVPRAPGKGAERNPGASG